MQNPEIILRAGCEGGAITLFGLKQDYKWTFYCESIDQALPLIGEGEVVSRRTNDFLTLEDALQALDSYQWHELHPVEVHSEFRDRVFKEVCWRQQSGQSITDLSDWEHVTKPQELDDESELDPNTTKKADTPFSSMVATGFGVGAQSKLDIVYVLTNPVMPGLIKIGYTTQKDAKVRIDQLFTTGVPVPFDIAFACKVGNAVEVERALHTAFAPSRINPKREFFRIDPEQAIAILKLLHTEEATDEVERQPSTVDRDSVLAAEQVKAKRPNMDFVEMSIPDGATLRSVKGNFTCTVIGSKKVMFEGDEMSLTAATKVMFGIAHSIQPSPHWTWNGKTLKEIYDETYNPSE